MHNISDRERIARIIQPFSWRGYDEVQSSNGKLREISLVKEDRLTSLKTADRLLSIYDITEKE